MHLKVAAVNVTNFFVIHEKVSGRYEGIDGIEFELLKILSADLNFTYELVSPKDKAWGSLTEDGEWTGMVGMLDKKEADMAIDSIVLTYPRLQVIEFTFPYYMDYDAFMVKKAGIASQAFFFVHTFQPLVWCLFMVCLLICSIIFSCLHYSGRDPHQKKRKRHWTSIFLMMEALIGSRGFGNFLHRGSAKLFFILSVFPIRSFLLCFTALLLSFLMTPIKDYQIKTFEELARACRSNTVRVSAFEGSFVALALKQTGKVTLSKIGRSLDEHPENVVTSTKDALEKALTDYAVIDTELFLKMIVHGAGLKSKIFMSEDSVNVAPISILFRKDFCCTEKFDKAILRIYQSNLYEKLVRDRLFKINLQEKLYGDASESVKPISFKSLHTVFGLLMLGCAIATIALFFERCCCKRK